MAQSKIPAGKARYSLTLTKENVAKYKALTKQMGIRDTSLMSTAVDDFLKSMNETMERCIAKGSATITDLFTMMGEQIANTIEEEKRAEIVKETKKMGR